MQPFLALAVALRYAGHEVRVAAPDDPDIGDDPNTVSLGVSFAEMARNVAPSAAGGIRAFREHIRPAMSTLLSRVVDEALQWQPDILVAHPKLLTVPVVAEHLGIAHLTVELTPALTPTAAFPAAGVLNRSLGSAINRLSYRAAAAGERLFAADIRAAKERVGISPSRKMPPPAGSLVAVSPTLLSRPSDWPEITHLTGDWSWPTPAESPLDPALDDFLAQDGPFLYAGFGSMRGGDASHRAEAIIEGGRRAGLRVLVSTGWGGLEPPPHTLGADVLVLPAVPHTTVLSRAAVAIHHGGAGTVHAASRAGVPSVLVPFLADQPFWARLLQQSGLAGPALHRNRLTADGVHTAIGDTVDRRATVQQASDRMRSERGAETAAKIITRVANQGRAA